LQEVIFLDAAKQLKGMLLNRQWILVSEIYQECFNNIKNFVFNFYSI